MVKNIIWNLNISGWIIRRSSEDLDFIDKSLGIFVNSTASTLIVQKKIGVEGILRKLWETAPFSFDFKV